MFIPDGSYFCCEPGVIGVNPKTGLTGGICEPADQPVPASLLATMASQIGAATATPISSNATQVAGPNQTNPSLPITSTDAAGNAVDTISHWSLETKIGVGIAVFFAFVIFLIISSLRRRRRLAGFRYGTGFNEYDEDGNLILHQGYRPGYEPYRHNESGVNNNVTVNVVRGNHIS